MRKQNGFTLVEVTIILLVLTILSTIMLPQLGNFNRLARFVKAREDLGAICSVLKKMLDEVHQGAVYQDNQGLAEPVGILFGPGRAPLDGTANAGDGRGNGKGGAGASTCHWRLSNDGIPLDPGGFCTERTDDAVIDVQFGTGRLEDHLIFNDSDHDNNNGDTDNDYPNPVDDPDEHAHGSFGAGAYFGWRGPYLDSLTTDPWGNRYAVNTFALFAPTDTNATNATIFSSAVVCYSAGADNRIDTNFNQPAATDDATFQAGWQFGRDDLGAVLSAGGPF